MSEVGFNGGIGHIFIGGDQCLNNFCSAFRREAPVAGKGHHKKITAGVPEGFDRIVIVLAGEIEIVEGFGHQKVGVGIESAGKGVTLMAQIAFHLEFNGCILAALKRTGAQFPTEFIAH